jgi:tetratricopeptide (TPR) repeat protein
MDTKMINKNTPNISISLKEYNTTLCLNMIVKNESHIITRLLDSVVDIIDCYCICDTGSTDNTIEVIQNYFQEKNILGKIIQEPFRNFCYNRNFALTSAIGMSDYILLLDADMQLIITNFDKQSLPKYDAYSILQGNEHIQYPNTRIIKNNAMFTYVGVTHEYISHPSNCNNCILHSDSIFIKDIGDGGCKHNKFERDVQLLTQGIADEPTNARYHFYLANTYFDTNMYEDAIKIYKKRIELGGWVEELFYSYFRIGICYKNKNDMQSAIYEWWNAFNVLPERLESLHLIIEYYRISGKHALAHHFVLIAMSILSKKNEHDIHKHLFCYKDVYTYLLYYEYTLVASYMGIKTVNNEIVTILNTCNNIPIQHNLLSNMKFYKDILQPYHTVIADSTIQIFIKPNNTNNTNNTNNSKINFYSSSSCLLPSNNGYCMNIRYVNYSIHPNGQYTNCDSHIISLNKCVRLDKQFNVISETFFETEFVNKTYIGIEDVRIYNTKNNEIIFIGTGLHERNCIGIMYGKYDEMHNKFISHELTSSFSNERVEKNWIYVHYKDETHIVYKWNPLQICRLDEERNQIILRETKVMPKIFDMVRGSTCGFLYTNEIWFVTHIVSYESPRHYYHMIVVMDHDMNLLRYSAPFKFEGEAIEYCLSIVVEDDRLLMNYSTWDRTTKIGIYDKKYIDSITKFDS